MRINIKKYKDVETIINPKVIFSFQDRAVGYDDKIDEMIKSLKEANEFSGKKDEVYTLNSINNGSLIKSIFVGLGEYKKSNIDLVRNISAKAIKEVLAQKVSCVDFMIGTFKEDISLIIKCISEAIVMSTYKFDKYISNKDTMALESVNIIVNDDESEGILEKAIAEGSIMAEGNILARELVNEPANILTPAALAERAVKAGEEYGFEVEIFHKKNIENFEMESFLAVGKGSVNEPKLIVMRYMGDFEEKDNILGFVGKGLTFDAGGYCLKTAAKMWQMKTDMGGAGAVIGAMASIAKMKLKKNVVAVIAACENLISGEAYRPGDIINTMNGKTIEILNTDAEGRLTLVDAVTYIIRREDATKIVDIATLTGAVGGALGNVVTGVVSNDDDFYEKLINASKACDEKVWRFPNDEEYKILLKGNCADLANITAPVGGGAITAGLFIGEFVEDRPWIHLDIAATAFAEGSPTREYLSKGATGIGARLLYELAKRF